MKKFTINYSEKFAKANLRNAVKFGIPDVVRQFQKAFKKALESEESCLEFSTTLDGLHYLRPLINELAVVRTDKKGNELPHFDITADGTTLLILFPEIEIETADEFSADVKIKKEESK